MNPLDLIPDNDSHAGAELLARPRLPLLYATHGSATRFHRAAGVIVWWHRGRLIRATGRALCGARLVSCQLTAEPPRGLTSCPRCELVATIDGERTSA